MQEPNINDATVIEGYLDHAVPIIRQYLDSHEAFTAELLQLTNEQDIGLLCNTLGKRAKKYNIPMEKLGAFLENKDYLPDYPALKAEREQKAAAAHADIKHRFFNENSLVKNTISPAHINETKTTTIARLSEEILKLTELLHLKTAELNSLVNPPENKVDNRSFTKPN